MLALEGRVEGRYARAPSSDKHHRRLTASVTASGFEVALRRAIGTADAASQAARLRSDNLGRYGCRVTPASSPRCHYMTTESEPVEQLRAGSSVGSLGGQDLLDR